MRSHRVTIWLKSGSRARPSRICSRLTRAGNRTLVRMTSGRYGTGVRTSRRDRGTLETRQPAARVHPEKKLPSEAKKPRDPVLALFTHELTPTSRQTSVSDELDEEASVNASCARGAARGWRTSKRQGLLRRRTHLAQAHGRCSEGSSSDRSGGTEGPSRTVRG